MVENISPQQVWAALREDPQAQLVDVRTDAEWAYVGLADLSAAAKQPVLIPWQIFPQMEVNAGFVEQLKQAGFTPEHHIYFLCRSGVRSLAAAQAARAAGFGHVFNVADGVEGNAEGEGPRGKLGGWKASGLPWRQR